jgi:hypothetical protein
MRHKKMDVPNISNLLGKITEKRDSGELPKVPIQLVQPVESETLESKNSKTLKQENTVFSKVNTEIIRAPGGRPSVKKDSIEYIKISPRIPKMLKRRVDIAIVEERFHDRDGKQIKTLDELVAFALDKLIE